MLIINSCCVFDVCFLHEIQQVTDWYMLLELARLLLVAFHTVVTALKSDSKVKGLFHLIKSLRRGHRVTCVYHVDRAPCLYLLITSSSLQPPLQPTFLPISSTPFQYMSYCFSTCSNVFSFRFSRHDVFEYILSCYSITLVKSVLVLSRLMSSNSLSFPMLFLLQYFSQ